jgi:hypothetical protein
MQIDKYLHVKLSFLEAPEFNKVEHRDKENKHF